MWERGHLRNPDEQGLGNLTTVETIYGEDGKRLFDAFKLKRNRKEITNHEHPRHQGNPPLVR